MTTTVDVVNGIATLDHHIEAVKQVAVADRILLTKRTCSAIRRNLAHQRSGNMRQLRRSPVIDGSAKADWILASSLGWPTRAGCRSWLACDFNSQVTNVVEAHGHGQHDRSRHGDEGCSSPVFDEPVDAVLFESCLTMLAQFRGQDLLRVKGIINGLDRPMVIHGCKVCLSSSATP